MYLNTDAAVGGRSFSKTIVDVRTQGLQRNGALVVMLGACDFRAAQTAAAGNLDARPILVLLPKEFPKKQYF